MNQPVSVSIANGRFEILEFIIKDSLDFAPQGALLSRHLRTKREQWTAQHAAAFRLHFRLKFIAKIAVFPKALERRDRRRKDRVQFRPVLLPFLMESRQGQVSLGIEEIIKTPLFDAGLPADVIDGRAAIGTQPHEFANRLHQSFFGITDTTHNLFSLRSAGNLIPATTKAYGIILNSQLFYLKSF